MCLPSKQLWPPVGLVGPLYLIYPKNHPPSIQRAKFMKCPSPNHTREQGRKGVWCPEVSLPQGGTLGLVLLKGRAADEDRGAGGLEVVRAQKRAAAPPRR